VQPVDKKRNGLEIATTFTAMDYPRFTLSKKRVGLTISQDTLTREEWSLYEDKPMDVPGTIKYEPWDDSFSKYSKITEWDPEHADAYPLDQAAIEELIKDTEKWSYGMLGTAFYWPIVSTARFEGTMYVKGGFLVLQLYDFYALTTEGISPEHHVDRWSWDWTQLYEVDNYLTPNRADNYLAHILEGTGWEVGEVDLEKVDIPHPAGSTTQSSKVDKTCNIDVSNGNCYNAITAVCQGLQLYPVFDCLNKKVSLKTFAGKNYGLVYRVGSNITSTGVKQDGEKVITKLYVSGGKDYNGDANINIGEAERSYFEPTDNPDERNPWNPNDPEYIIKRSPYGTNYILNFKWMYDNKWMSKEQILGLYAINQQINDLNKNFMPSYAEDRRNVLQKYNDAINEYDLKQGEYQSILNSMMNKYYKVPDQYSKGTFYAFHKEPLGTHSKDGKCYLWINHCFDCGETTAQGGNAAATTCPHCGSTNIQVDELYIPVYRDFDVEEPAKDPLPYGPEITGFEYAPHLKGDYLKLLTTLDNYDNNSNNNITYYEGKISLIEPIAYAPTSVDGYIHIIDGVRVRASSGNIDEWNDDIAGFVKAYGEMIEALAIVNYCLEKIKELEEAYADWKAQSDKLHEDIQKEYGDFIVEGNYKNDEQPYVGLLFNEGMEASDKYAIPEITYNLDVIDSSGLIEYRQPWPTTYLCGDCGYENHISPDECPGCKSKNLVKIHDTYNDLVRMLHSVGQIIPKAGDYVIVYDEQMGLYGVPALITDITRYPDNPVKNSIKLDTSYTDDEELVGNIINATNTVLSNKDIYARTAVLKADGTIDSQSISKTLDNPNANVSIVGTDGNMLLTGSSLRFTNPNDETRAMKYSGTGVFSTTTYAENGEGTLWERLMTPYGINATYINAGTIDTKNINILSGTSSKILMDQYGLSVKNNGKKGSHITEFDADAATKNADYARNWGETNNIAGFMGVDPKNNAIIYTKGFLVAEEGSNIANWITSDDGFYHLSGTTKDLWLSPNGINGTVNGNNKNFAIYAGGKFGVTTDGTMYATGANIQGDINATSLTLSSGIKIGENNLTLTNTEAKINANTAAINANTVNINAQKLRIDAHDTEIAGRVTFSDLSTGGKTTINGANITTGTVSADRIDAANLVVSAANVTGELTAATISGGKISGGTISGVSFESREGIHSTIISAGKITVDGNDTSGMHTVIDGYGISMNYGNVTVKGTGIKSYYLYSGCVSSYAAGSNTFKIETPAGSITINGTVLNGDGGGSMYANKNCCLTPASSSYYAYVRTTDTSNRIAVNSSGPSSLNVKTNLISLEDKYDALYEDIKAIGAYDYDYKYKRVKDDLEQDYGFIIDEIEGTPVLSNYFRNFNTMRWLDGDVLLEKARDDEDMSVYKPLEIKEWERDAYIKGLFVMIKTLQHKIDKLEEQIKKEKE